MLKIGSVCPSLYTSGKIKALPLAVSKVNVENGEREVNERQRRQMGTREGLLVLRNFQYNKWLARFDPCTPFYQRNIMHVL